MKREEAIRKLNFLKNTVESDEDFEIFNMAIKALEQESVLDTIRAEIIEKFGESECAEECGCLYELLDIIDKHSGESEKV